MMQDAVGSEVTMHITCALCMLVVWLASASSGDDRVSTAVAPDRALRRMGDAAIVAPIVTTPGDTTTTTTTTVRQAPAGQRVPLWLKIAFTLMVLVIVPIYWRDYGPGNFLWLSDVALFGTAIALWIESPLLAGMMLVGTAIPEVAWQVDFWIQLAAPLRPLGITDYMFDDAGPLYLRLLSLYHMPLLACMIWLVWRFGYDRGALPAMLVLGWAVLTATYLWTDPAKNVNWVFGWHGAQSRVSPDLYFAGVMVAFPLLVWLPTHLLLRWLVPAPHAGL